MSVATYVLTVDWSQAPEWAMYFAIDKDGIAFWYRNKPKLDSDEWYIDSLVYTNEAPPGTHSENIGYIEYIGHWTDTLCKRPE